MVDESAPVAVDAPDPFGAGTRATVEGERLTLDAQGIEGVVRFGQLYGPGTYFASDGDIARQTASGGLRLSAAAPGREWIPLLPRRLGRRSRCGCRAGWRH